MSIRKIALITGGSRGLGREMALTLSKAGHDVIITYHTNASGAHEVIEIIQKEGGKATAIPVNLENAHNIPAFIESLKKSLHSNFSGRHINFLINNAGMGATLPFEKVTDADFDRFMQVHLKSVFFLTQQVLPLMQEGGSIIQISSGTTRFCVPGYSLYASMKGGVEVLTKYLAKELGPKGIRVNVVAPGPVETDFNDASIRNNPDRKKALAQMAALGRVGQPQDIASVIKFLCSEESAWITGQRIEVSGGITL
jgi:NAD(P)-dependent dehydrogenase (short-subunit alcohol dehydrogenase family)